VLSLRWRLGQCMPCSAWGIAPPEYAPPRAQYCMMDSFKGCMGVEQGCEVL
jgi:hypothetical protein